MSKLFLLLAMLFLVACSPVSKLVKSNVALVDEGQVFCSGVAVSEKHILTANHCIHSPVIQIMDGGKEVWGVVIKQDAFEDLALIEVVGLKLTHLSPVSVATSIALDEPAINVGNPRGVVDVVSRGNICKLDEPNWYNRPANIFCGFAWYGSSGSGIYNEQGQLIGILTQVGPQGASGPGAVFIVPLDVVREFLELG